MIDIDSDDDTKNTSENEFEGYFYTVYRKTRLLETTQAATALLTM